MSTLDDINQMVIDINKRAKKLNQWELEFVTSIEDYLASGRRLSTKQDELLTAIWDHVTE